MVLSSLIFSIDSGRLIATGFLHLPDKVSSLPAVNGGQQQQLTPSQKKNPNYYKTIALPIAIDTVEVSLNPHTDFRNFFAVPLVLLFRMALPFTSLSNSSAYQNLDHL